MSSSEMPLIVRGVRLTGTHFFSFRPGKPGLVMGLKMVTPPGYAPRLAFEVMYPDGVMNYVAYDDTENYTLEALSEDLSR